jgi:hypothetical protein
MGEEHAGIQFPPDPRNKEELIERILGGRVRLEKLIDSLSDEELTAPGPDGAWSVKDHLAHLTAWERLLLARLQRKAGRVHEIVGMDQAAFEAARKARDYDTLNAGIYRLNSDRSLTEVRADFDGTTDEVLSTLEGITWDDLQRASLPDDPSSTQLLLFTAGNTYEHFTEHMGWIRELVDAE